MSGTMMQTPSLPTSRDRRTTLGTYLLAVILVLSLGAGIGLSPQAAAQIPAAGGDLSGVITDVSGHPLQDVTVTAKKQVTGSTWHYYETRTGSDGGYALEDLEAGTWNLSFQKDGYWSEHEELNLELNTSEEHDVSMRSILESTLSGYVYDTEIGEPLAGAKVRLTTWDKGDPEERNTTTDEEGAYEIPLFTGENEVLITKSGYSNQRFWVYGGQGDVSRDAWLWSVPPQTAVVEGQVIDAETGEGVQALVTLRPDHDRHHDGGAGATSTSSSASDAPEPAIMPVPSHQQNNYNSTVTDEDGRFRMDAHAGHVVLEANREGYLVSRTQVTLEEDTKKETDLELEALPERSVTLSGVVKNAKNGSTLPGASVAVQVPEAGDHQYTQTDEDGYWEIQVRPGHTLIEVHYWGGPYYMESEEAVAHDEAAADDKESSASSSSGPSPAYSEPEPVDPHPPQERTRYYPAVRSLSTVAGADRSLDIDLHPEREATTTIVGYVIDAQTEEAVSGVHVSLQNHETSAWGNTLTDEDGSFRFETHGGYHTLRAYRDGFLHNAVNLVAPESGTNRVDLEIRAGHWAEAGWWSPDGHDDRYYRGGFSDGGPMMHEEAAVDDFGRMSHSSGAPGPMMETRGGSAGLEGRPGGLGPYQGPQGEEAPAPGVVALLLVATLALAVVRTRRSQ